MLPGPAGFSSGEIFGAFSMAGENKAMIMSTIVVIIDFFWDSLLGFSIEPTPNLETELQSKLYLARVSSCRWTAEARSRLTTRAKCIVRKLVIRAIE